MYNLRAILAAFIQHWKTTTSSFWSLSFLVGILPAMAAWVLACYVISLKVFRWD
jgi:hypothetical protein